MTERKPFLLRIDAELYAALARWAEDETRSLNGQMEALLRRAVEADGRLPASASRRSADALPSKRVPLPTSAPRPPGRGHIPRRLSTPATRPKVSDRASERLPKPAALRPAEPQPPAARPSQGIPADSWDAMED